PRALLRDSGNNRDNPQDKSLQLSNKRPQFWDKLVSKWVNWRKKQMVGWYNPVQLVRTGRDVFISTVFGEHADRRLVEALTAEKAFVFDYQGAFRDIRVEEMKTEEHWKDSDKRSTDVDPRDEIWIDYVGDVGDGWNSTYGVAFWLAQEKLPFSA